jgi:hypothetical protein
MWRLSVGGIPIPLVLEAAARSAANHQHYYGELSPEQRGPYLKPPTKTSSGQNFFQQCHDFKMA